MSAAAISGGNGPLSSLASIYEKETCDPLDEGVGMGSMKLICDELVDEVGDWAAGDAGERVAGASTAVDTSDVVLDASGVSGRTSSHTSSGRMGGKIGAGLEVMVV